MGSTTAEVVVEMTLLVVVAAAVVVVVGIAVVLGTVEFEQAASSANPTISERRIGRSYARPSDFPKLSHAAADREVGHGGVGLVDGDGQFDAVGIGMNYVDGVDVDPGVGQLAGDLRQLARGVGKEGS